MGRIDRNKPPAAAILYDRGRKRKTGVRSGWADGLKDREEALPLSSLPLALSPVVCRGIRMAHPLSGDQK